MEARKSRLNKFLMQFVGLGRKNNKGKNIFQEEINSMLLSKMITLIILAPIDLTSTTINRI